jgi:ribosomal protein L11 methyltransferase
VDEDVNPKIFYRLKVHNVPRSLEGDLSQLAFEYGAQGVQEDLAFEQTNLTFEPRLISSSLASFEIYFSLRPSSEFLNILTQLCPQAEFQIYKEEEKDWLELWKKDFKPFVLTHPYWIVPSWCELPCSQEYAIRIDPGMAFGTGTHATTKMCAFLLAKFAPPGKVLDLGTGTGVLGILAEKLGAKSVIGLDNDGEALRVAKQNLYLNQCQRFEVTEKDLSDFSLQHSGQFDSVVANIVDGVLIQIKPLILRILKPRGRLILSGILEERDDIFWQSFIEDDLLTVVKRVVSDGWVAYAIDKQDTR